MSNQESNQNPQLLSAKALAKMLSTSVRSVWRYRSSQALPKPVSVGSSIRWKLSDISLFLDCNCDMQVFEARKGAKK